MRKACLRYVGHAFYGICLLKRCLIGGKNAVLHRNRGKRVIGGCTPVDGCPNRLYRIRYSPRPQPGLWADRAGPFRSLCRIPGQSGSERSDGRPYISRLTSPAWNDSCYIYHKEVKRPCRIKSHDGSMKCIMTRQREPSMSVGFHSRPRPRQDGGRGSARPGRGRQ